MKATRRNHYLFQLALKLLGGDIDLTKNNEATSAQIRAYVYDNIKGGDFKNTHYGSKKEPRMRNGIVKLEDPRDPLAVSYTEHLRKYVLDVEDFKFKEEDLDTFVQQIRKLGVFPTWADFERQFRNDPIAIQCECKRDTPFSKLSDKQRHIIRGAVNKRVLNLKDMYVMRGLMDGKPFDKVLYIDPDYILRRAVKEDIYDIETLAKLIYPCPINDFYVKEPWFSKNPSIFFVCRNSVDNLIANINLLPLTERFYNRLKTGALYEDAIGANDIYSADDKRHVKYIYIEGLASVSKYPLQLLARHFEEMLAELAYLDVNEITICSIGGSFEGDKLMKNKKFVHTGWAVDSVNGDKYPFLEVKWKDLKQVIDSKIELLDSLIAKGRLTPIKNDTNWLAKNDG